MGTGIWASTVKMMRATVVNRASRVSRLVSISAGQRVGVRRVPGVLDDDHKPLGRQTMGLRLSEILPWWMQILSGQLASVTLMRPFSTSTML